MSSTDTSISKTHSLAIQGFSVLKMKEEIREKFFQDVKNMTTEELLAYIRNGSEQFQRTIATLRAETNARSGT